MIGSILTLAGFIAWVISVIPVMQKYTWKVWLERVSIFKLYNPVQAVSGASPDAPTSPCSGRIGAVRIVAGLSSASSAATCRPTDDGSTANQPRAP